MNRTLRITNSADLAKVKQLFAAKFSGTPIIVKAKGRINIIGEHTDYNNGFVLPAAIDKHMVFAVAKNGTNQCRFYAVSLNESYQFTLENFTPGQVQWGNYLKGIFLQFLLLGVELEGVDVVFGSNLPIGVGMSSSAALECGFALALSTLFNYPMDRSALAQLAKRSSNTFMNIPSGIMDQFASLLGKAGHAIKLDCRDLSYEYIPVNLKNYDWVLLNSRISHDHASGAYKDRVEECKKGVEALQEHYPAIQSLRDAQLYQLEHIKDQISQVVYNRCAYVIQENERLQQACEHLKNGQINKLGELLFETHHGLSKMYEVSCPEIDFLVDFAKQQAQVAGARIMGGGFGGCTLNLVQQDQLDEFVSSAKDAYQEAFGITLRYYKVQIEQGTEVIA
jgi:galactokinase